MSNEQQTPFVMGVGVGIKKLEGISLENTEFVYCEGKLYRVIAQEMKSVGFVPYGGKGSGQGGVSTASADNPARHYTRQIESLKEQLADKQKQLNAERKISADLRERYNELMKLARNHVDSALEILKG